MLVEYKRYCVFIIQFLFFFRHVLDVIAGIKSGEGSTEEFRNDLADQIYHNTKNVFFSSIVEN